MNALEFSATIKQGLIKIPDEYKQLENSFVRIIILSTSEITDNSSTKKERLKKAFQDLRNVKSFAEIENVSEWQKALRDEWN